MAMFNSYVELPEGSKVCPTYKWGSLYNDRLVCDLDMNFE